ncbi:50S ribosomal protein L36 [Lachnospiraceae bacterium OttesenSCG-928-E19]|nr:50S ribosomal protein L36 [Lachnospiraceae bacterium OttesenSCG-928-E19]
MHHKDPSDPRKIAQKRLEQMKFLSSLKAWKKRGNVKQIRRGKQVILIDKENPKFKAKQGFKRK